MILLYLDFLCPKAHLNLDINQLVRLSKICEVTVISEKGRYVELPESVVNIENNAIKIKGGRILNRLSSLKIMAISALESSKIEHDVVLVSSFETLAFYIGRLFFNKKDKIVLIHHFNTDELKNRWKAIVFKKYMNDVKHMVYSDFIKDYLVNSLGIDHESIYVVPHHMNQLKANQIRNTKYKCVGLSNSNDESVIEELIELEVKTSMFKNTNTKIVLKSKKHGYNNGFLEIVNGFLDKEIYDNYINSTESIYLPFPSDFEHRMSGTLIDALSNGIIVYGSDIPVIRYYGNRYPRICKITKSTRDFAELVISNSVDINVQSDFVRFEKDHSHEAIEHAFRQMLDSIL